MKKILLSLASLLILCAMLFSCNGQGNASDTESDTLKKYEEPSTTRVYNKQFIFFDANGDGVDDHIIEHDLVAISGGAGGYQLYIYNNYKDQSYKTIFDSDVYLDEHEDMDVEIIESKDGKLVLYHPQTEYKAEYVVKPTDKYYSFWFNEDGNDNGHNYLMIDTFNAIEVKDFDGDGGEELEMHQYTSYGGHSTCIGDCITVWKVVDGEMKLIDLRFEFLYENNN